MPIITMPTNQWGSIRTTQTDIAQNCQSQSINVASDPMNLN